MQREKRGPQVIARGVVVGLLVGLTPTLGFHTLIVVALWGLTRKLDWDFNLVLAFACTWVSNPANALPLYYLYYKTGQFMRGAPADATVGLQAFSRSIGVDVSSAETLEGALRFMGSLLETLGGDILIGSLPYAILLSALGYGLSLWGAKTYHRLRGARRSAF